MYEIINNVPIQIKEYNGQRVVTFKDIDRVHNRPEGTARKRFNDNRERFIEGEDFFIVNQPSEIRTLGLTRPQGGTPASVILITEYGYMMLVKSFTDDLAWDVQRQLVNTYFRVKTINNSYAELIELLRSEIKSDKEETINMAVEKAVSETVKVLAPYMKAVNTKTLTKKDKSLRKSCNYQNGKMDSIPQGVRRQVDEMIISRRYSCQKIADFITANTGMSISYMTVSRYIKKYFNVDN